MSGAPVVLVLFGTRPEAIKLAPVVRALEAREEEVTVRAVSTGQHDDLLEHALASFDLRAEANLEIMRPDQDLFEVGSACLLGLRDLLRSMKPDVVVVEGDTATVFFGALAAFFERVSVGHVESGLRSGDKFAPFPEEIFRRLTDVVSDYFFAPTSGARANLLAEGIAPEKIHVTGNTVIDAVQALAASDEAIVDDQLRKAVESGRPLVLVTAHRRESFGDPIRSAFTGLRGLAERYPDHIFVYPVHPNPNVKKPAHDILAGIPNLNLLQPLVYSDMVKAMARARLVITDSGGVQEEAPTFDVPVMVMREVTERPEGVEVGAAVLVGTSESRILEVGSRLLQDDKAHAEMAAAPNPYGDGRAGERIADILLHALLGSPRITEDWT